jgi:hypothetical protein
LLVGDCNSVFILYLLSLFSLLLFSVSLLLTCTYWNSNLSSVMTDYGYDTPVIRLPKSKVDRYSDHDQANDTVVSETLYLKSFPSTICESDLRQLLQQYQPLE